MAIFVRKNGYRFVISEKVMYLIAIAVARNKLSRDDLADILRDHITDIDPSAD